MNCPTCNYALWNLRERRCPECGRDFLPSEFSFVANSVRFCCPHCNQDYYGTDANGHLVPQSFGCISCGQFISMDEMVLLPTEGVDERQTRPDPMPWLEKSSGNFLKRWWGTVIRSMGSPGQLIEQTPVETSAGSALGFLALNSILPGLFGFLALSFMFLGVALMPGAGALGIASMLLPVLFPILGLLVWAGVWTVLSHALLFMLGGTRHSLGRSFHCIAFSSGPNLLTVVPCLAHMIAPLAWIWWMVSATIMMKRAHRAPGWKASIATLTPPIIAIIAIIIGIVALINGMQASIARAQAMAAAAAGPGGTASLRAQSVATAVTDYVGETGLFPAHAAELVANGNAMPHEFSLTVGDLAVGAESIGGTRLDQLAFVSDGRQRQALDAAAGSLPPNVVAHRIGDFVFTFHGMSAQSEPSLWILMAAVPPAAGPAPGGGEAGSDEGGEGQEADQAQVQEFPGIATAPSGDFVHVATLHGTEQAIPAEQFSAALAAQNQLRAAAGLAPLPHPLQVLRTWPP